MDCLNLLGLPCTVMIRQLPVVTGDSPPNLSGIWYLWVVALNCEPGIGKCSGELSVFRAIM